MQKKMSQPLMLQNCVLYGWGVAFNGINWFQSMTSKPAIGILSFWPIVSIVFYAVYGLSISVIIKQFGSVTRTFINTAAICCTALLDFLVLGERITLLESTTFGIILIAIYIYSIPAPELAKLQAMQFQPVNQGGNA
uniref:EamA domain-containing protein n=1 Tax=Haptolina ericina TaxID=156174 RepID=A0A6T8ZAV5_9EUKA